MANSGNQLPTVTERLPLEIMSEIFILCTPLMMPKPEDVDFRHGISVPLNLSSVCRLWRSLAQSTPAVWTSFRIYIPSRDFPQRIQQAKQWLSRSGQLPLSIQIYPHPSVSLDLSDPLVAELINIVNSYSHRWESLEVAIVPELYPFHGLSKSTPILKTLILSFGDNYGSSYDWLLGIHWNNVVHFTVHFIGVGQALEILRLSPQLQEYFLIELWSGIDDALLSSHLRHARLETLYLDDYWETVSTQLLDSINLPSLKIFQYSGSDKGVSTLPYDSIVAFLNRSGCSLKTFSLQYSNVSQEMLIRLLFAMPHLETLTLGPHFDDTLPYVTDKILNILADTTVISARLNDQPDGPFLPMLRSFKYTGYLPFSWKCIPTVFGHGTKEPGACPLSDQRPLRSFSLELFYLERDPGTKVVAELKRLRDEEGYEIQILEIDDNSRRREVKRDLLHGKSI